MYNMIFMYEPCLVYEDEIYRKFPKKCHVFYEVVKKERDRRLLNIKMVLEGTSAEAREDGVKYIRKFDGIQSLDCKYIEGCEKHYLHDCGIMMDDDDLFCYSLQDILYRYEEYKNYYGDEAEKMCLLLSFEGDHYCFYGTSIEPIQTEKYWKNVKGIVRMPIEEYKTQARQLHAESESSKVLPEIRKWVEKTTYADFASEIKKQVIGQKELEKILINVYMYLRGLAQGVPCKNNILLSAPSGCGKTETFRAMRKYFEKQIPTLVFQQIDVSNITESGYKGSNPSVIIKPLLKAREDNGIGILFLDEFDKKLIPSINSNGVDNHLAVQHQLLTMIEGAVIEGIDTTNTMFIACGSFNEQRKKKGAVIKHVGFGASSEGGVSHYAEITRQDILDAGANYEMLGRFCMVVNYGKLDMSAIDEIIELNRVRLEKELGVSIEIGDAMREILYKHSNSEFGCRMLRNLMTEEVMPALISLYAEGKNVDNCTIFIRDKGMTQIVEKASENYEEEAVS